MLIETGAPSSSNLANDFEMHGNSDFGSMKVGSNVQVTSSDDDRSINTAEILRTKVLARMNSDEAVEAFFKE